MLLKKENKSNQKIIVSILMGSDSDVPYLNSCFQILKEFSLPFEVKILSAHRTPDLVRKYAEKASKRGIKVIIAAAGGAAHLAGALAAQSLLPIIGVPLPTSDLKGLDALLSTVQMPKGIPVACMAIGHAGASNAALLTVQIIALEDSKVLKKLVAYRKKMAQKIKEAKVQI